MNYRKISDKDWDAIKALAAELINYSAEENAIEVEIIRSKILEYLNELDQKYGPHPQIYDTVADYIHTREDPLPWRLKAYELCMDVDHFERNLISRSIAEYYLYENTNEVKAWEWYENALKNSQISKDKNDIEETEKLKIEIEKWFRNNKNPQ